MIAIFKWLFKMSFREKTEKFKRLFAIKYADTSSNTSGKVTLKKDSI